MLATLYSPRFVERSLAWRTNRRQQAVFYVTGTSIRSHKIGATDPQARDDSRVTSTKRYHVSRQSLYLLTMRHHKSSDWTIRGPIDTSCDSPQTYCRRQSPSQIPKMLRSLTFLFPTCKPASPRYEKILRIPISLFLSGCKPTSSRHERPL